MPTTLTPGTYYIMYKSSGWGIDPYGTDSDWYPLSDYDLEDDGDYTFNFQVASGTTQFLTAGFAGCSLSSGFKLVSGETSLPATSSPLSNTDDDDGVTQVTGSIVLGAGNLISGDPKINLGSTSPKTSKVYLEWDGSTETWKWGKESNAVNQDIPISENLEPDSDGNFEIHVKGSSLSGSSPYYASVYTSPNPSNDAASGTVLAKAAITSGDTDFVLLEGNSNNVTNADKEVTINIFSSILYNGSNSGDDELSLS